MLAAFAQAGHLLPERRAQDTDYLPALPALPPRNRRRHKRHLMTSNREGRKTQLSGTLLTIAINVFRSSGAPQGMPIHNYHNRIVQ